MTFDEYQERAAGTAIYPEQGEVLGLAYTVYGLTGECGEIAQLLKKALRDDGGVFTPEFREKMTKEIGDTLWYLSALATEMELTLDEIAEANLKKLAARQERGTLGGSGDDR